MATIWLFLFGAAFALVGFLLGHEVGYQRAYKKAYTVLSLLEHRVNHINKYLTEVMNNE